MTFSTPLSQIPTEKQILRQLKKIIFGPKVWCPDCGRKAYVQQLEKNRLWRCRKCRNKFSVTSITWLKGMKITVQHLWLLIWCWQRQLNIQQVKEVTKLSIPTIRRYYALFRDNLQLNFEVILQGNVQMDEMFVKGGFIIGAKDIKRKKIELYVISKRHPTKTDAMNFIYNHVRPGSCLNTDGGGIYRGCDNWWPINHRSEIHKKFEFEITSEIEGIWANLRTFIRRMYHHVTMKTLPKIVAEFEARFSQPEIFENPLDFLNNTLSTVTLAL